MRLTATLFLACIGLASLASSAQAQVVPVEIRGTAIGDLISLEAYGEAVGRHLGRFSEQGPCGSSTTSIRGGSQAHCESHFRTLQRGEDF